VNPVVAVRSQARSAFEHARAAHARQKLEDAWAAIDEAVTLAPGFPAAAFLKAQVAFESWRPSVALFEAALELDRGNQMLVRNFILALAAEGQEARAEALLSGILARNPGWLEGHLLLSTQRLTGGAADPYASYRIACEAAPSDCALHLAWFHRLASARDWAAAEQVLERLEQCHPASPGVAAARLFMECESGRAANDPAIFAPFAAHADAGLALTEVRHALRCGDPGRADAIAARWTDTMHAAQFWPYRDLAWRMTGDPGHAWLSGDPAFAAVIETGLEHGELDRLAVFLRSLHRMQEPFPEQSVQGGTQTARNLLMHHDPLIAKLRVRLSDAVAGWRDGLPDGDGAHPLLDRKPAEIRFQGSWSVRLAAGGHHRPHIHPKGWASSAFYVALPKVVEASDAGQFALGMPPPELGLALGPERWVDPVPGRLVLFPSTSWHGTLPFSGEERLTLAFDIAPAGGQGEQLQ